MSFYKKHPLSKFLIAFLSLLILSIIIFLSINKSENSEKHFSEFIEHYTSKNIDTANNYIFNSSIPNISNLFFENLKNSNNNQMQTEIIDVFEKLFYSIDYKIISSKTFLNSSILNINFSYYDLSAHIMNFFKNSNQEDINYENFLNSIKSTKYKISKNLNIKLIKKNNKWKIILSDDLINILIAGLKNFEI